MRIDKNLNRQILEKIEIGEFSIALMYKNILQYKIKKLSFYSNRKDITKAEILVYHTFQLKKEECIDGVRFLTQKGIGYLNDFTLKGKIKKTWNFLSNNIFIATLLSSSLIILISKYGKF